MSGLEKIEQHKIAKCPLYSCTEDEQWKKINISHCHFQYSVFVNSYPGWYWWHSASAGELKGKRIGQCLTIIEGGPPASRQGKLTNIKILSNDDCQTVDEIFDLRCKIYDLQNFTNLCKVGLREGIKMERGSPLYKLFGAGWGQKGVGGFFLKIRPHSCV